MGFASVFLSSSLPLSFSLSVYKFFWTFKKSLAPQEGEELAPLNELQINYYKLNYVHVHIVYYTVNHKKPCSKFFVHNFSICIPILRILSEFKSRVKVEFSRSSLLALPV